MEYINGMIRYSDEEVLEKIKDSASKIGKIFKQDRYRIEQIYFGNATAYYCCSRKYPFEIVAEKEDVKRQVFYYMDDSGLIYKSYVEIKHGKYLATDLDYKDEVTCQIVGLYPTHNDGDLVRR